MNDVQKTFWITKPLTRASYVTETYHKAQTILHGFAGDLLADRLYSNSTANRQQIRLIWFRTDQSTANLQQIRCVASKSTANRKQVASKSTANPCSMVWPWRLKISYISDIHNTFWQRRVASIGDQNVSYSHNVWEFEVELRANDVFTYVGGLNASEIRMFLFSTWTTSKRCFSSDYNEKSRHSSFLSLLLLLIW